MAHLNRKNEVSTNKKTKHKKVKPIKKKKMVKKQVQKLHTKRRINRKPSKRSLRKQQITYDKDKWYKRLWQRFVSLPAVMRFALILLMIFIPASIISGYVQNRLNNVYTKQQEKDSRYEPNSNYLVKQGATKYLKDQLDLKTNADLKKAINETKEYHGQYNEIIASAKQCKTNADLWAKLNPVVEAVESGERYYGDQSIKPEFKVYTLANTPNVKFNNLLVIAYNSKDESETKLINDFVKKHPDITVFVYDTTTKGGKSAFESPMYQFLNDGGRLKNGYDEKNSWTGVAYGFMNNNLTYHTKNLNDLNKLKELPTKSLADPSIVNKAQNPIAPEGYDNN